MKPCQLLAVLFKSTLLNSVLSFHETPFTPDHRLQLLLCNLDYAKLTSNVEGPLNDNHKFGLRQLDTFSPMIDLQVDEVHMRKVCTVTLRLATAMMVEGKSEC